MPTSNHDMEYRHFEGVLPAGYGAGPGDGVGQGTYNPEVENQQGCQGGGHGQDTS